LWSAPTVARRRYFTISPAVSVAQLKSPAIVSRHARHVQVFGWDRVPVPSAAGGKRFVCTRHG